MNATEVIKIAIDANIFDKLSDDAITLNVIRLKVLNSIIKICITPTIYFEIDKADNKNGTNFRNLLTYTILDDKLSIPPFMPGKVNIGGNEDRFSQLVGNISNNKRKKDPRILDTLEFHGIDYFITNNRKDFRKESVVKIIDFFEFKEWVQNV